MIETNEYQTALTDEFLDSLPQEVRDELLTYIDSVPFIKGLISPDRKRAKDLPKDKDGKIIIDFAHPHILEDMEYFRPTGNYFRKHGVYTKLIPNANPKSEFGKWLATEIDRIWNGMVRPSDGEWIPGELYFYWNYTPIKVAKEVDGDSKQADRVEDFPDIWEATYFLAHYLNAGRKEGLHGAVIASRGKGKSFYLASALARLFTCGDNKKARRKVLGIVTAYQKEYLVKDGTLNKFVAIIDFLAKTTQFPRARYKSSFNEMNWIMGYVPSSSSSKAIEGTQNEILGVSSKDNSDNLRGKRSTRLYYEEFGRFPKFINTWNTNLYNVQEGEYVFGQQVAMGTGGCVCAGTKIFTAAGNIKNVEDLEKTDGTLGFDINNRNLSIEHISRMQPASQKFCIEIITNMGRRLKCSFDHPILKVISKKTSGLHLDFKAAETIQINDQIAIAEEVPIFGSYCPEYPRAIGWLVGDGTYGKNQTVRLANCDPEILEFMHKNFDTKVLTSHITKNGQLYEELRIKDFSKILRTEGIMGQTKLQKKLPNNIGIYTKQAAAEFLGGLFDTDGYITLRLNKKRNTYIAEISLSSMSNELLEEVRILLQKFGIHGRIRRRLPRKTNPKDKNAWYEFTIADKKSLLNFVNNISFSIQRKQERAKKIKEIFSDIPSRYNYKGIRLEKVVAINNLGILPIYNFTTDTTHTYLANGIITHNTEGSDFSGALELIYHPTGYFVKGIPNLYDKGTNGATESVFFIGAYLNEKGYYNKDGVSDVVGALVSEIKARIKIKYNSSDPTAITQRKAEKPFTIQEAVMRNNSTIYPVADLVDRILEIDQNPRFMDDLWIGQLSFNNNKISYKLDPDSKPIWNFPHKDNKLKGSVIIAELPVKDSNGEVPRGRYIAGIDPFDDDVSNTVSLGSIYILDLWTDKLVFEYTGRPMFANEFYEICRRALLMYNAECNYENNKKGLFTYFSEHNCLYLLSPTLDFLKDRELVKGNLYGNKAYGTNASEPIKAYARRCIRDWLLKPEEVEIINENKEVETVIRPQLFSIPFRALLQELQLWTNDGNFDRHDALGMLMLLREDKLRLLGGREPNQVATIDTDYLGNDAFFNKNYKRG